MSDPISPTFHDAAARITRWDFTLGGVSYTITYSAHEQRWAGSTAHNGSHRMLSTRGATQLADQLNLEPIL